jgi:hypothetical protein
MKVYLAGPMRGYKDFNFPAFMKGAHYLRALGHTVFNPAENDIEKGYMNAPSSEEVMRACILDDLTYICKEAEAIALLPGWSRSKGVAVELAAAKFLDLVVWELPLEFAHDRLEQVSG